MVGHITLWKGLNNSKHLCSRVKSWQKMSNGDKLLFLCKNYIKFFLQSFGIYFYIKIVSSMFSAIKVHPSLITYQSINQSNFWRHEKKTLCFFVTTFIGSFTMFFLLFRNWNKFVWSLCSVGGTGELILLESKFAASLTGDIGPDRDRRAKTHESNFKLQWCFFLLFSLSFLYDMHHIHV